MIGLLRYRRKWGFFIRIICADAVKNFTPLTQTELHVLTLIADGRSNVQIADYLDISVNTVKFHCKNIFQKLDATNRQQAIKTAQELKLLRK